MDHFIGEEKHPGQGKDGKEIGERIQNREREADNHGIYEEYQKERQ